MMIEMTESEWSAKYRPIKNHLVTHDTTSFDTSGEELDFVTQQPSTNVWTAWDADEGVYIRCGYYLTNTHRVLSYYVTEIPWTTDGEEEFVTLSTFEDCECQDDDGNGKQDCETCGGDGFIYE